MATVGMAERDRSPSIGRIFSRGFGTLGSNPLATFGIAAVLSGIPGQALGYVVQIVQPDVIKTLGGAGTVGVAILTLMIGMILSVVTQGALVRATVAYSEGRRARLGECLSAGLVVALPLVGLAIVSGVAIGLALLLIVVPGIMLYVMWSVAGPALVEERLSVFESLRRSRHLTRGVRWKVFGLFLVLVIAYWIFSAVVTVLFITAMGGTEGFLGASLGRTPLWVFAFQAVAQTVSAAVWGVVQTSLYVELREWRDGPTGDRLAEVFQ